MLKKVLIATVLASVLPGCAVLNTGNQAEFSCPGMPSGVVCKSPKQVYSLTHTRDAVTDEDNKPVAGAAADASQPSPALVALMNPTLNQPSTGPLPVREPSRVMRIWVAPWVDSKHEDLHWPGYVFTEIQPRRWSFGQSEFTNSAPVVPYVVDSSQKVSGVPAKLPKPVAGKLDGDTLPAPTDPISLGH